MILDDFFKRIYLIDTDAGELLERFHLPQIKEAASKYDIASTILINIYWAGTPQGYDYWSNIHEQLLEWERTGNPPELPDNDPPPAGQGYLLNA